jgi:hypothetical protein
MPSTWQVNSWSEKPDGGICLVLGRASQYVVAIDVDDDDAVDDVRRALPYTDVVKRGQKGATFFFRSKTVVSSFFNGTKPDGRIVRLVDVLGEGKQTVLPPSIHPKTGVPYVWTGNYALDEIEPSDLPELPENTFEILSNVLREHGYNPDAMPHSYALDKAAKAGDPRFQNFDDSHPYRQLNEEAWSQPEKWILALNLFKLRRTSSGFEAVGVWSQSGTGKADADRERNLKINVHRHTIVDFGDGDKGYSPIDLVARARRLTSGEAFRYLSDILQGYVKVDLSQLNRLEQDSVEAEPAPAAPIELPPVKAEIAPRPNKSLMDITQAPGLLGMLAAHGNHTARRQQPMFAMAAAIATVGLLAGRQYRGPTGSSTALYMICCCPTGYGKQHPLDCIAEVVRACGLENHLGPSEFKSDVSITSALSRQPNLICCMDEIANFMGKGSSRNAASYETGLSSTNRSLWSASFRIFTSSESAARQAARIYWPHLIIFGVATEDELYSRLSASEITNGLLNRFIIIKSDDKPAKLQPESFASDVPADLIEACRGVYHRDGLTSAPFHGDGVTPVTAPPEFVPFADDEAKLAWIDIEDRADKMRDDISPLYARAAENTIKVATIRAIGIDWRKPAVTVTDLAWAEEFVFSCVDSMVVSSEDKISDSSWEGEVNKVLGFLKRNKRATRASLIRSVRLPSRRLEEVLSALKESERIEELVGEDSKHVGRKAVSYTFLK